MDFIVFAVCFGPLSCWKISLLHILRSLAETFSSITCIYLALFMLFLMPNLSVSPFWKQHWSMMLPPPCLLAGHGVSCMYGRGLFGLCQTDLKWNLIRLKFPPEYFSFVTWILTISSTDAMAVFQFSSCHSLADAKSMMRLLMTGLFCSFQTNNSATCQCCG